jgi:hypothetical protein
MKKTTVLMAAMLAVATVLTAGLTVLPGSVQEAQANPCSNNLEADESSTGNRIGELGDQECTLIGNFEGAFDEDESSDSGLAAIETDGAEAITGNNIIDDPLFDLADAFDESD